MSSDNLRRIPNTDAWLAREHVVAVARLADSQQPVPQRAGEPEKPPINIINFSIRSADGKTTVVQHHDRKEMQQFLASIGVVWEG